MSNESLEQIERQMAGLEPTNAPPELRAVVLQDVQRELRAARRDRRLTRAAAVLFIAGVMLNLSIGLRPAGSQAANQPVARSRHAQSLVDTAVVVAEVTDAATGRRFARQLAAIAGLDLTTAEAAAIDAAIKQAAPQAAQNGNRG
jgi:hypothetical protein